LLTGMDVANASMYDGATATVEAVMMANRVTRRKKALVSGSLHPHYRQVVETYGAHTGFSVESAPYDAQGREDILKRVDKDTSCVVIQNPSFFGHLVDFEALCDAAHAAGAMVIAVTTEAVSYGLVRAPGNTGCDVAVAEGQSFGNPLGFGGPYVGLFACKEKFLRQMPGRLAGQTVDVDGKRGWVLTLSTREQHIRREKATSNICTNSGLCALAFTIHLTLLGEAGLQRLAELNHATASNLADRLTRIPGVKLLNETFFNEFTLVLPKPAAPVVEAMAKRRVLGGVPVSRLVPNDPKLANLLLVAATETVTEADMAALETALKDSLAEVK
ncbi:MAG: aminomethyl-transferring glycine dehydrogenase subunit GcvPA, partial [Dongia sp.]